ncbi:MAG: DUF2127 domain-containing protein [Burkholderiales bacterium]|nr:DUF2127 domain-containing protein [Burkholderiales bacterium]
MRRPMRPDWGRLAHRAYRAGLALKALDGLLELGGGAALLGTPRPLIRHLVALLTRQELFEDPHDLLAGYLSHLVQHLSLGTQQFAGIYLMAHGAVKLAMVAGLLMRRRWSYPLAVLLMTGFIGYEGWHLAHHASVLLALLTATDSAVLALIVHESRQAPRAGHG